MEADAVAEMLVVVEKDAIAEVEVAFQTEAVAEMDAVGEAVTVKLDEMDVVAQTEAVADVMGLVAFLSTARAAEAPWRKAKGGLTGPVRAGGGGYSDGGETSGSSTSTRAVISPDASGSTYVRFP